LIVRVQRGGDGLESGHESVDAWLAGIRALQEPLDLAALAHDKAPPRRSISGV